MKLKYVLLATNIEIEHSIQFSQSAYYRGAIKDFHHRTLFIR